MRRTKERHEHLTNNLYHRRKQSSLEPCMAEAIDSRHNKRKKEMNEELREEARALVEMITEYWSKKRVNKASTAEQSSIKEMITDYWSRRRQHESKETQE